MRSLLLTVLLATAQTTYAGGGGDGDIGNGGGTWTCREKSEHGPGTGALRWAVLIDLFEGRQERELDIPLSSNLTVDELLDGVERKIFSFDQSAHKEFKTYLDGVRDEFKVRNDLKLVVIPDAKYRSTPAPETCEGGQLSYEQLANDTGRGYILVDSRLYDSGFLTTVDQAALYVHEAIYRWFRARQDATDSLRARELVGYLMSDTPIKNYASLFPAFSASVSADAFHILVKEDQSFTWKQALLLDQLELFQNGQILSNYDSLKDNQPACRTMQAKGHSLNIEANAGYRMMGSALFKRERFDPTDSDEKNYATVFYLFPRKIYASGVIRVSCRNTKGKEHIALTVKDMRKIFGGLLSF